MSKKSSVKNEALKQLTVFKKGTVDLISEEELLLRIEKSLVTGNPLKIKYGVDPSASDIHLGHTVPLFKLRSLQDLGHEVIFLIGDFTARIGDPSLKSETRKMLSPAEVKKNAKTYAEQVFKILRKDKTQIVYNSHWLQKFASDDFLELTTHFTVHRMIERDDFKKRFEAREPISLLEFMYPLLQAYDSVHLKADIELGGTDQKFNLLMGRELQRDYKQPPQAVITLPILEGTDGVQKMSKSLGNAIGINLEPFEMFGKIMSLNDDKILPYFELCTNISDEEFAEIKNRRISENPRNLKAELGKKIVAFYHDESQAKDASLQFDKQFREKQVPDNIKEIECNSNEANIIQLSNLSPKGLPSGSEIRRLIKQGGIKVNGEKITDISQNFDITQKPVVQYGKRIFRRYKKK